MTEKRPLSMPTRILLRVLIAILFLLAFLYVIYDISKDVYPREYQEIVTACSQEFDVPEEYIFSVIYVESRFKATAVSSADARGLMQLKPATYLEICQKLGMEENLSLMYDPATNIRCGTYYLSYLYGMFGNWHTVFAAYNAGLGNVGAWLKDERYTDGRGNLTYIPFAETRKYIDKIYKAIDAYTDYS